MPFNPLARTGFSPYGQIDGERTRIGGYQGQADRFGPGQNINRSVNPDGTPGWASQPIGHEFTPWAPPDRSTPGVPGGPKGPSSDPVGGPSSGSLPFQNEQGSALAQLYRDIMGQGANEQDLNMARDRARQEAVARGINGPLAATIGGTAQASVINDAARRRNDQLMRLVGLTGDVQGQEQNRRTQSYQMQQASEAARRGDQAGFLSALLGLLGGGIGAGIGGPAGAGVGFGLGQAGGNILSGVLNGQGQQNYYK